MLRRLIVLAGLTAGMCAAVVIAVAPPALAKGPTLVRITGPGLAHPIVISGGGEPGQLDRLAVLATQTGLYTAMFGPNVVGPAPARLRTPPPAAALGPRYIVVYTVPGVTPLPGQQFGRIQEDLYPHTARGPVIYIPPGQHGFGQPLLVTGWLRATPRLVPTLARLGVPSRLGGRAAPAASESAPIQRAGPATWVWLVAAGAVVAAAALAGMVLRHRRPGPVAGGDPSTAEQR